MKKKTMFFKNSGWEPEYQAVLDYATSQAYTLPSEGQSIINNAIIKNLKSLNGGQFNFDLFYYFQQEAGLSDFAKINWGNPSSFNLTENGTMTFVADSGFESLSSQQASFSTGYIPATHAVNISEIDFTCFYKTFDIPSTPAFQALFSGCRVANDTTQWGNTWLTGTYTWRAFYNSGITPAIAQSALNAHYQLSKDGIGGNGHMGFYVDGALNTSSSSISGGLTPTYDLDLMGYNLAGTHSKNAQALGMGYFALGAFFGTVGTPPLANEADIYAIMNGTF